MIYRPLRKCTHCDNLSLYIDQYDNILCELHATDSSCKISDLRKCLKCEIECIQLNEADLCYNCAKECIIKEQISARKELSHKKIIENGDQFSLLMPYNVIMQATCKNNSSDFIFECPDKYIIIEFGDGIRDDPDCKFELYMMNDIVQKPDMPCVFIKFNLSRYKLNECSKRGINDPLHVRYRELIKLLKSLIIYNLPYNRTVVYIDYGGLFDIEYKALGLF